VSRGGLVTAGGVMYLAGGGPVLPMWLARGTDTVPAMLTPGEAVLNRNATATLGIDAIRGLNAGHGLSGVSGTAADAPTAEHLEQLHNTFRHVMREQADNHRREMALLPTLIANAVGVHIQLNGRGR
jgi:hypothetical protein